MRQGRFVRKAGMRIDRDAAAVVANRNPVARGELDLDSRGVAGDRLVHRVVEHFGGKVMQPAFVGAADIHAGAAANRLQPFENLDVLCGIAVGCSRDRRIEKVGHDENMNIRMVRVGASSIRYRPGLTALHVEWIGRVSLRTR